MKIAKLHAPGACVLAMLVSGASVAAIKNNYIAPEARSVAGGRDVHIIVSQAEIQPNINISNITAATGGGLLFALIDAGVNNARAKEAEKQVVPLREALVGYDFDPLVQHASTTTLQALGWFDPKQVKLSKEETSDSVLAALNASTTSQLMVLRYTYETNADFSAVVVSLYAYIANKAVPAGKKPDARLQLKYVPYNQSVRSFVRLPGADLKHPEANVKAWAADGGKVARAALDMGVARCQDLLTRSLRYSAADAASMVKRNKRKMTKIPGFAGWELESQANGALIYDIMTGSMTRVETHSAANQPAPLTPVATPVASDPTAVGAAPAVEAAPAIEATPAVDATPAAEPVPAGAASAAATPAQ
jgi:hypothetical protein